MSTEKFFIADPYNEEHIRMFDIFEQEHNIQTKTAAYLKDTNQKYQKSKYQQMERENNTINQSLFLQDNSKIKDSCHIQGEKDIKTCTVFFAPIKSNSRNRPLISLTTDYAFNVLGMEEIFVLVYQDDASLKSHLEIKNFENLGLENGYITYLKEKEEIKEMRRII